MALIVPLILSRNQGIPDGVIAVLAVISGAVGSIFYVQGCVALAEAKGYTGAAVAGMIVIAYFCFLPLFFIIPLVLILGLKDKTQDRFHRR